MSNYYNMHENKTSKKKQFLMNLLSALKFILLTLLLGGAVCYGVQMAFNDPEFIEQTNFSQ